MVRCVELEEGSEDFEGWKEGLQQQPFHLHTLPPSPRGKVLLYHLLEQPPLYAQITLIKRI